MLDAWLDGQIEPIDYVWTLWGYHPLTDINYQNLRPLPTREGAGG